MVRIEVDLRDATTLYRYQGDRIVDASGYVLIWREAEGRYFSEHRLIAASALGRPLLTEEEVHHVNGRRWHNFAGNLIICSKEYHEYLDSVMRLKRSYLSFSGRMKQWRTIYHFFHSDGKSSSVPPSILKKIKAYIRQPFTERGTRKRLGPWLVDPYPPK